MKKTLWLSAALMPVILASCGGGGAESAYHGADVIEYLPIRVDRSSDWSMIGPDGEYLFEELFSDDAEVSCVVNGVFSVSEKDKISVYTAEKSPKVIGDLEGLKAAGYLMDGVMPVVRPQQRITLVDKEGKLKATLEPVNGKEITGCSNAFSHDRLIIGTEEDKFGYVDTDGKAVIAPTFDYAEVFNADGYAVVGKVNDDNETVYSVIDTKGEIVTKFKAGVSVQSYYDKHFMTCNNDNRYAIYNLKGESVKLPSKFTSVSDWNNDFIVVHSDNGWGVIRNNDEFEEVIRPRYDNTVELLPGDRFMVQKDDDVIILDKNGERVYEFSDAEGSYCGARWNILVKEGSDYYFADLDGKHAGKAEFQRFNGSPSISGWINSDFFNVDAFVGSIADEVTADAISGFKLGAPISNYVSGLDPSDYSYSFRLQEDKVIEGYHYTISSNFISVTSMASWSYNDPYSYYDYSGSYKWNDTTVESASLRATAQCEDLWKTVKPQLVKRFESLGFKVVEQDDTSVSMKGSKASLYITGSDSYGLTEIVVNMSAADSTAVVEVVEDVPAEVAVVEEVAK